MHRELGLSGKALAETILTEIGNLTFHINNCRGQGYDGAVSVFGHIDGLSAHTLRINEKGVYTNYHSHRLNLEVAGSFSIQYVRNILDQIKKLSFFFNFFWAASKNDRPFHRKTCSTLLEEEVEKCWSHKMGWADHRVGRFWESLYNNWILLRIHECHWGEGL